MTYVVMMKKYSIKERELADGVKGNVLGCDLLRVVQFESNQEYNINEILHVPFDCCTKGFKEEYEDTSLCTFRIIGKEHVLVHYTQSIVQEDYTILEVDTFTSRKDSVTVDDMKHDVSSPTVLELFKKIKGLTILS